MSTRNSIQNIVNELNTTEFVLNCRMPLGYRAGLPIIQINNGILCLVVPFLKYKITGVVDQTLVYPIRYTVTLELPEEKAVAFSDLSIDKRFCRVDFNKPIGLFRHESIKDLTKAEYNEQRNAIFALYDKLAAALLDGEEFSDDDDETLRGLLRRIVEPSLYPMYRALDKEFYEKYLA